MAAILMRKHLQSGDLLMVSNGRDLQTLYERQRNVQQQINQTGRVKSAFVFLYEALTFAFASTVQTSVLNNSDLIIDFLW